MNPSTPLIQPGTLWQRILETSRNGIASGALQPIETEQTIIEENGIRFQARWVSSLRRKAETKTSTGRSPANPFLPPEPELTLGAVSDTHIGVLNKFNVIDNHLLIVTREFQPQETLLDLQDFSALCRCLPEFPSLGFYNGGAEAGASQGHKHLQLIPLPLMEGEPDLPIQPLLDRRDTAEQITSLPGVSFSNALVRFSSPLRESDDRYCLEWYLKLLDALDMPGREENGRLLQSHPYNLLLTRDWMLLVPRSREHCRGISINALGFAGSLFVKERAQIQGIRSAGPMELLLQVALPCA